MKVYPTNSETFLDKDDDSLMKYHIELVIILKMSEIHWQNFFKAGKVTNCSSNCIDICTYDIIH